MRFLKHGAVSSLTAAALIALPAALAPASVTPDPYKTRKGSGSFTGDSVAGPSECALSRLAATATGTRRGADIEVQGFDASCTGVINGAEPDEDIPFRIRRGKVTGEISVVITNVLGGECRYAGRMTGSIEKGDNKLAAAGTVNLVEQLASPCAPSSNATVDLKFPKASFSWRRDTIKEAP